MCKVTKLQGSKVAGLQGCKVARLQSCISKVTKLQGCKVTKFQDIKVAWLQGCNVEVFPDNKYLTGTPLSKRMIDCDRNLIFTLKCNL